jgi:hypothetical protein
MCTDLRARSPRTVAFFKSLKVGQLRLNRYPISSRSFKNRGIFIIRPFISPMRKRENFLLSLAVRQGILFVIIQQLQTNDSSKSLFDFAILPPLTFIVACLQNRFGFIYSLLRSLPRSGFQTIVYR